MPQRLDEHGRANSVKAGLADQSEQVGVAANECIGAGGGGEMQER